MLQIGDIVHFACVRGYGGHGATCEVVKINRKSIKAVEVQGSYRKDQAWTFGCGTKLRRVTYNQVAPFVTEEFFCLDENGAML